MSINAENRCSSVASRTNALHMVSKSGVISSVLKPLVRQTTSKEQARLLTDNHWYDYIDGSPKTTSLLLNQLLPNPLQGNSSQPFSTRYDRIETSKRQAEVFGNYLYGFVELTYH